MRWFKTSEVLPERDPNKRYSQVPCLVVKKGRRHSEVLMFNHEHECWDDADGDDTNCLIEDVEYWMPLPEPPHESDMDCIEETISPTIEEIEAWAKEMAEIEPTGAEEFGRIWGAKWMRDLLLQKLRTVIERQLLIKFGFTNEGGIDVANQLKIFEIIDWIEKNGK